MMTITMTDNNIDTAAQLLADYALSGDKRLIESFVGLCLDYVYRCAFVRLGNQSDAEDIAQDCMMRLMASAEEYNRERPLLPWIVWHVHISCSRFRRKEFSQLRRKRVLSAMQEISSKSQHLEIGEALEKQEQDNLVRATLLKLSEKDRNIIELHYFNQLTQAETATVLGITENSASVRLHRARTRLKRLLVRSGCVASLAVVPTLLNAVPSYAPEFQTSLIEKCSIPPQTSLLSLNLTLSEKVVLMIKMHPWIVVSFTCFLLLSPLVGAEALREYQHQPEKTQKSTILDYVFKNPLDDYYKPGSLPFFNDTNPEFADRRRRQEAMLLTANAIEIAREKYGDVTPRKMREGMDASLFTILDAMAVLSPMDITYAVHGYCANDLKLAVSIKDKSIRDILQAYAQHYDFTYVEKDGLITIMPPDVHMDQRLAWELWDSSVEANKQKIGNNELTWLSEQVHNRVKLLAMDTLPVPRMDVDIERIVNMSSADKKVKLHDITLRRLLESMSLRYRLSWMIADNKIVFSKGDVDLLSTINTYWTTVNPIDGLEKLQPDGLNNKNRELLETLHNKLTYNFLDNSLSDILKILSRQTDVFIICDPAIDIEMVTHKGSNVPLSRVLDYLAGLARGEWIMYRGNLFLVPKIKFN